jgi:hypothetical protein
VIYVYSCNCGAEFQAEAAVDDRYRSRCPECDGTAEQPDGDLVILIQPVDFKMKHVDRLITEEQLISEKGPDWRETPGSRRMFEDMPERTYHGTHDGPGRRRGKSWLNHSPATDSPEVQAAREAKTVKDKLGQ